MKFQKFINEGKIEITSIIKHLIKKYKKEFNKTPYQINDGMCEDFALDIKEFIEEAIDIDTMWLEVNILKVEVATTNLPGHVWILYKNKHYDVETINGVSDWKDITIFKKFLKSNKIIG
jgi:hypothetical protein